MLPRSWSSCDRSSSVEANDLTSDIRSGGGEKVNKVRHILRRARSIQRNAVEIFLSLGLRIIIRPFDDARRNAIDGDFRRKFTRQPKCEVRQRRFACTI